MDNFSTFNFYAIQFMEDHNNQFEEFENHAEYVKFWPRAGAYILDGILVGIFSASLNVLNITNFKSFSFYLIVLIIGALYKPYLEYKYGATLGKMMLKMRVTDYNHHPISFDLSLIMIMFLIVPSILYIPIYYFAFNNPNIEEVNGFLEFSQFLSQEYPVQGLIAILVYIILIVEIVVLLTDSTKTQRSLHDQFAKTYVIYDRR